jgi:hypothetical protein
LPSLPCLHLVASVLPPAPRRARAPVPQYPTPCTIEPPNPGPKSPIHRDRDGFITKKSPGSRPRPQHPTPCTTLHPVAARAAGVWRVRVELGRLLRRLHGGPHPGHAHGAQPQAGAVPCRGVFLAVGVCCLWTSGCLPLTHVLGRLLFYSVRALGGLAGAPRQRTHRPRPRGAARVGGEFYLNTCLPPSPAPQP